jgi:alpha-D-xyloside xylohydrolase
VQSTNEAPGGPVTFFVYTGADGHFELYEDDGETYGYLRGERSLIPVDYDDAEGTLTIGARTGEFEGMPADREFRVRWIDGPAPTAADFAAPPDASVEYRGEAVTVAR